MNKTIENIKKDIERFFDENGQIKSVTVNDCRNYSGIVEDIHSIIKYISLKYDCEIECEYIGGFDNPGYGVECYAWAGIVEGELYFDYAEIENY